MYNLRYHIASLVAVFLALAIGLLLGSVVVDRGVLDAQRGAIVKSLKEDYESLSAANREQSADIERLRAFTSQATPVLVDGALEGERTLVLANGGRAPGVGPVRDAVRLAGGDPVVVTVTRPAFGLGEGDVDRAVEQVIGSQESTQSAVEAVAARLSEEWSMPSSDRALTEALREAGVLRMDRLEAGDAFDNAAIMVTWDQQPDAASLQLGTELQRAGLVVVGAEAGTESGIGAAAAEAGLSAVDSVEKPESQFPLVWLLAGEARGHYGAGPGADRGAPRLR